MICATPVNVQTHTQTVFWSAYMTSWATKSWALTRNTLAGRQVPSVPPGCHICSSSWGRWRWWRRSCHGTSYNPEQTHTHMQHLNTSAVISGTRSHTSARYNITLTKHTHWASQSQSPMDVTSVYHKNKSYNYSFPLKTINKAISYVAVWSTVNWNFNLWLRLIKLSKLRLTCIAPYYREPHL